MRSSNKRSKTHIGRDWFSLFSVMITLLVILFIGSAIIAIIIGGLPDFFETIRSREVLFAFRLSLITSTISSILVMLLAMPSAYTLTRIRIPGSKLCEILIELTLSLPYLLLGLSLLIIFSSPAGKWLKSMGFQVVFAPAGIVMAHVLVNLSYAIRMIKTAFADSDERLEYIARTLGASRFRSFTTILLPMCKKTWSALSFSPGPGPWGNSALP